MASRTAVLCASHLRLLKLGCRRSDFLHRFPCLPGQGFDLALPGIHESVSKNRFQVSICVTRGLHMDQSQIKQMQINHDKPRLEATVQLKETWLTFG